MFSIDILGDTPFGLPWPLAAFCPFHLVQVCRYLWYKKLMYMCFLGCVVSAEIGSHGVVCSLL